MENSKLLSLLRTLDRNERRRFILFLQSPYFTQNQEIIDLGITLIRLADEQSLEKETVYAASFPEAPFDGKKLGYLMNGLLKQLEHFLCIQDFEQDMYARDSRLLKIFLRRDVRKHYNFFYGKIEEKLRTKEELDPELLLFRYQIAEVRTLDESVTADYSDKPLQLAADRLDEFFLYQKLRYACAMLNRQTIFSYRFHIPLMPAIEAYFAQMEPVEPMVRIYFAVYQSLRYPDNDSHFHRLKALMKKHRSSLVPSERVSISLYAINYCSGKIRKGIAAYTKEALNLYVEGVKDQTLFDDGYLSNRTYSNIIKLALMDRQYDWAETFIHEYNESLPPRYRKEALHYNLGELYYHRENYDAAHAELIQLNFRDGQNTLGSRILLIKIFFEKGELEPLLSQLAAFTIYLKRTKKLGSDIRKSCLNFCKLLHKYLRLNGKRTERLREEIRSTPLLAERRWLQQVLSSDQPKV